MGSCSAIRKLWWFSPRIVSWKEGVGAAHFQIGEVAIQPAENARVVAADIEDPLAHG
jgi:hypothetical protein